MLKYKLTKNLTENQIDKITEDKRVKVVFTEPFATIENLVKLAKKESAEVGFAVFKSAIISSKDECIESIKKEPLGSDFNCSSCFKWWRLGDCLVRWRLTGLRVLLMYLIVQPQKHSALSHLTLELQIGASHLSTQKNRGKEKSYLYFLEVRRFELLTPCVQSRCSTS